MEKKGTIYYFLYSLYFTLFFYSLSFSPPFTPFLEHSTCLDNWKKKIVGDAM